MSVECVLAAVLPVTSASPRSAWDIGGAIGNTVNLVPCAPTPTSIYIALPQGPPTIFRLDAPDQGVRRVPVEPFGSIRWRSI
jgi:hypothetical protein